MINKEDIEKIKNNSIGTEKKSKLVKYKKIIKKSILLSMITLLLIVCVCICKNNFINLNIEQEESISSTYEKLDYNEIGTYILYTNDFIFEDLEKYGILGKENVTPEDYKRIEGLNEDQLIYYYITYGKDASEKVVQALGYQEWDDFLQKNEHVNEKGEPDIAEWVYEEYQKINDIMEMGNVR